MKRTLFLLFLFISFYGYAQEVLYVNGRGYEGYIYPVRQNVRISTPDGMRRYTPTASDIALAERILCKKIDDHMLTPHGYTVEVKSSALENYYRQYVGYLNSSDEKVIWINLIHKNLKDVTKGLAKDIVLLHGNDTDFWNILVNIPKEKLSDFKVNQVD